MIVLAFTAPFAGLAIAVLFLAWAVRLGRRLEHVVAQAGDVDSNGDIIDELRPEVRSQPDPRRDRLDGAIGETTVDVDRTHHLALVLQEIARTAGQPGASR